MFFCGGSQCRNSIRMCSPTHISGEYRTSPRIVARWNTNTWHVLVMQKCPRRKWVHVWYLPSIATAWCSFSPTVARFWLGSVNRKSLPVDAEKEANRRRIREAFACFVQDSKGVIVKECVCREPAHTRITVFVKKSAGCIRTTSMSYGAYSGRRRYCSFEISIHVRVFT